MEDIALQATVYKGKGGREKTHVTSQEVGPVASGMSREERSSKVRDRIDFAEEEGPAMKAFRKAIEGGSPAKVPPVSQEAAKETTMPTIERLPDEVLSDMSPGALRGEAWTAKQAELDKERAKYPKDIADIREAGKETGAIGEEARRAVTPSIFERAKGYAAEKAERAVEVAKEAPGIAVTKAKGIPSLAIKYAREKAAERKAAMVTEAEAILLRQGYDKKRIESMKPAQRVAVASSYKEVAPRLTGAVTAIGRGLGVGGQPEDERAKIAYIYGGYSKRDPKDIAVDVRRVTQEAGTAGSQYNKTRDDLREARSNITRLDLSISNLKEQHRRAKKPSEKELLEKQISEKTEERIKEEELRDDFERDLRKHERAKDAYEDKIVTLRREQEEFNIAYAEGLRKYQKEGGVFRRGEEWLAKKGEYLRRTAAEDLAMGKMTPVSKVVGVGISSDIGSRWGKIIGPVGYKEGRTVTDVVVAGGGAGRSPLFIDTTVTGRPMTGLFGGRTASGLGARFSMVSPVRGFGIGSVHAGVGTRITGEGRPRTRIAMPSLERTRVVPFTNYPQKAAKRKVVKSKIPSLKRGTMILGITPGKMELAAIAQCKAASVSDVLKGIGSVTKKTKSSKRRSK